MEAYYADHLGYPPNIEPFHPAPGKTIQPTSRVHFPLAPAPPPPLEPGKEPAPPGTTGYIGPSMTGPGMAMDPSMMQGLDPSMIWGTTPYATFPQAATFDQETSPVARPYLEAYGGVDKVLQGFNQYGGAPPYIPGGKNVSFRLALNGLSLTVLTTPVAYLGTLPQEVFLRNPTMPVPCVYFSYHPYDQDPTWKIPATGHYAHYFLASWGPDTTPTVADPYVGSFDLYDPTNGTISGGDIVFFDGIPYY
jgi:hypothetical protein